MAQRLRPWRNWRDAWRLRRGAPQKPSTASAARRHGTGTPPAVLSVTLAQPDTPATRPAACPAQSRLRDDSCWPTGWPACWPAAQTRSSATSSARSLTAPAAAQEAADPREDLRQVNAQLMQQLLEARAVATQGLQGQRQARQPAKGDGVQSPTGEQVNSSLLHSRAARGKSARQPSLLPASLHSS